MPDFASMTGPQLVAAWNEMALTAVDFGLPGILTVKKFADHKTGIARCQKLHAQLQSKKTKQTPAPAAASDEDDLAIPAFLLRKPGERSSAAPGHTLTKPRVIVDKKPRDWRIPKGMSDEEGAAMLAKQEEVKKLKTVSRITTMREKKMERDAAELAKVNAAREAKGLPPLTNLNQKTINPDRQETTMATKKKAKTAKKTAAKAATNGSGKWMSDDATITKLEAGKDYDPRKGTTAEKLWSLISNNMKVGTYKEKGKKPSMPYLRWFIAHNYVKVSG
jgi:hypothetical protein